ncbi:MAG TPA: beta-ketoacyl-ACP synthase III [Dehalococcoidia bacterium]|nr:beta-ketoacyl-ACP synthase III [Dehalococcoidia bacterium]
MRTRIAGLGHYLPERVMTNAEIERMVDTSDQWIRDRTGIRERRIAAPHETSSSLATEAARRALADAGIDPATLDLVLVGTTTPDGLFPSVASLVQDRVGAVNAGAFDMNAACFGFMAALTTAFQYVATGASRRVLVIGVEVLSRIINWRDRGTCVLFGDGAGALVLEAAEFGGPLGFVLHSDGSKKDYLFAEGVGGARDAEGNGPPSELCYINMDGPALFKFAVHSMTDATREALARAHLSVGDIDLLVPHQANLRIIQGTAKALGLPMEKAVVTIERYGNTSSATLPVALSEAYHDGRLFEGQRLAMCSFGGGLAWGSLILEYSRTGVAPVAAAPVAASARG